MIALKLRTVGTSVGTVFPKELLAKLDVGVNDTVYITDAPDGSFRITKHNPVFERQMELAREIMHRDHDILRELAK